MTFKKDSKFKGFLLVDNNTNLLYHQRYFNEFLKKYLSDATMKFLWVILHLKLSGRYFLYKLFISA
ncbi:peptidase [Enterococcus sp. FDAARGOS_375]|nr:peptidase [Enterococcus sp. FDAARGOS_375]